MKIYNSINRVINVGITIDYRIDYFLYSIINGIT